MPKAELVQKVNDNVQQFDVRPKQQKDANALLDLLAEALIERFPVLQQQPEVDLSDVEKLVADAISKLQVPTTVELLDRKTDTRIQVKGPQHKRFPELLYFMQRGEYPYLYGPTQSGKSTAIELATEALGRPYYYLSLNPQTPDSRLMGYNDANGREIVTVFRKAYEFGGTVCLDETDNSSAALLTTLNSALANAHASFPGGMVKKHPDFICACTGNTPGRGGTPDYPERRSLDGAFAQRFKYLEWGYDEALEQVLTAQRNPEGAGAVLAFVREVRAMAETKGWRIHATPTTSICLASYLKDKVLSLDVALDAVLFKGIDKQTRDLVISSHEYKLLQAAWGA
jgi:hypothetical protein